MVGLVHSRLTNSIELSSINRQRAISKSNPSVKVNIYVAQGVVCRHSPSPNDLFILAIYILQAITNRTLILLSIFICRGAVSCPINREERRAKQ